MTGETMLAARLHGPRDLRLEEVRRPEPGPGQVLVRVEHVGICGSDVHVYLGHRQVPLPLTLGHEALGRVVAVGPGVPASRLGERVVIEPNIPCGACDWCRAGRGNICPHKQVVGINCPGAFAQYLCVPAAFAWPLPPDLPWQDALIIEPLAVNVRALRASGLAPGDQAVVVGCGPDGLVLAALLLAARIDVLALDLEPARVEAARRLGAEAYVMEPAAAEAVAARLRAPGGPQVIFECTGSAAGAAWSVEVAPRGGRVVWVGLAVEGVPIPPLRYVREGIELVGTLIYDHPADFRRAIRLVAGGLRLGHLIDQVFPLAELAQAMDLAAQRRLIKAAVHIP